MSASSPRPNLFLIGAMKAGTTYLSELLGAHPDVFMSAEKEPCHFVDQRLLRHVWPYRRARWGSEEHYLELFAGAESAKIIGEASTTYSQAPMFAGVPERILEFSPDARFIYLVRDPIERTISHYWHRVRWWGERRPIRKAILSDPHYTDVSHYAKQLREYLRLVELKRIYVLTFEELVADPITQMSGLYMWLGVDPSFRPQQVAVPLNVTPRAFEQARGLGLLHHLRQTVAGTSIPYAVPSVLRRIGARMASRLVRPDAISVSEVEAYLQPRQQRETAELGAILNRAFPEWRRLYGADEARFGSARDSEALSSSAGS
jgi:hypothetical protein